MFSKRHPRPGAAPGSLVVPETALSPRITVIDYDQERHEAVEIGDPEELSSYRDSKTVSWVDVQGVGDAKALETIARIFSIHPLALEDVVNSPVRPKSELYEHNHLVITRMVRLQEGELVKEQVTIFIGPTWVITFQDLYGDVFEPVRMRTHSGTRMRKMGPDYLGYALMDTVIDSFFPVLESFGDRLEILEDVILDRPTHQTISEVFTLRRELLSLRRSMWPQRDAVNSILRDESPFIGEDIQPYLRDCYDHAFQITDILQSYLDLATQLTELYMSIVSNKMNEVMKVLTVMASIFIPLSFVAGVYGMNFDRMPELHWPWAYFAVLGIMLAAALGLLAYFRHRGWIGRGGG
jgi:magnesium transporter